MISNLNASCGHFHKRPALVITFYYSDQPCSHITDRFRLICITIIISNSSNYQVDIFFAFSSLFLPTLQTHASGVTYYLYELDILDKLEVVLNWMRLLSLCCKVHLIIYMYI